MTPIWGLNIIYHMSVWTKVLLGLFGVAALVFFHAAIRTLKTFSYWSGESQAFESKLREVHKQIVSLRTADHEHPRDDKTFGVQQLRTDLGRLVANRGRIWSNCTKKNWQSGKAGNGRWEATISTDDPGLMANMLVYAFEEGDDQTPGKYLGEYAVKSISQSQGSYVLESTTQPTPLQRKSVQDSKLNWVLYEMMPADQHLMRGDKYEQYAMRDDKNALLVLTPEVKNDLLATLPNDLRTKAQTWLPEFDKDGMIDKDGKPLERKLNDYLDIMRVCEEERTLYDDRMHALERDENLFEERPRGFEQGTRVCRKGQDASRQ